MKLIDGFPGTLSPDITPRETAHRDTARKTAADTMVLLANNGVLPLREGTRAALYGAAARHTIMGGTGSGAVNCRPGVNVEQGLLEAGIRVTSTGWLDALDREYDKAWKAWRESIYAMSIPGDFTSLYTAHASHPLQAPAGDPIRQEPDTEIGIYVISRVSGEGADRHPVEGDFLLSDTERRQLKEVRDAYPRMIVVLNMGGVMDTGWMEEIPADALILMGQAGMEGGNALGDVITGKVNPSARLAETWAKRYEDYPCPDTFSHMNGNLIEEKYREGIYVGYRWFDSFEIEPRYPFGHGLSYTNFKREPAGVSAGDGEVTVHARITNTGAVPGRDAVLLFAACPEGLRRKERKRLIAFAKTKTLAPGETEDITLRADLGTLASYHAGQSTWYLDSGNYRLLLAQDAAHYIAAGTLKIDKTLFGRQMKSICPLHDALPEMKPDPAADRRWQEELENLFGAEGLPEIEMTAEATRALEALSRPAELPKADDPLTGSLSLEEKACLVCGRPNEGDASFIGDAALHVPGAAAETTSILEQHGIPATILADGPAGLRLTRCYEEDEKTHQIYHMTHYESLENRAFGKEIHHDGTVAHYQFCTAIPVGMNLAQSYDPELVAGIGQVIGREMKEFGITWWLAPGMNIKRNPLCGRNFEYYSEDPLVSGRVAAAITRGVQGCPGAAVTIKHFACNNQEDNRRGVSSIVSERALREIYLKGFEIAVREAQPLAIMTSYNKLNGEHTANSRDLCTVAAREEWGFGGLIMTDWTTTNMEGGSSAAKCIAAGNDLIMPGLESDIREIIEAVKGTGELRLDEADLDACCSRILGLIRKLC